MTGLLASTSDWILTAVIFAPLVGAILLLFADRRDARLIRSGALVWSLLTALLVVVAVTMFVSAPAHTSGSASALGDGAGSMRGAFSLTQSLAWFPASSAIDIRYSVGIDGISICLLALTAFLTPLAIWGSFSSISNRVKEYYALLLILETGMLGVFCSMDLLLFYVFFEFTLIPLFFLIGIWGGPDRARAAGKFFIFTVAGSVLTFAGVLYLAYYHYQQSGVFTLDLVTLTEFGQRGGIPANLQWWLFGAFAAGFAIKVPLFPVHTWLPLAHTEAPTAGSVILAGVLLKLGSYGFCRLSLPILPEGTLAWAPFMSVLAIGGIIYGALAAWVQDDVKKLVAYSSVSHMGFCMLGLFSLKMAGITGGVMYMLNHGLSTAALFLVIGMVYERYHTRDINKIGGLAKTMPWMAFFMIVFTLSSIGLPGLNGFIGEFLVLLGTATSAATIDGLKPGPLGMAYAVPAATGIVLGAVYMLWMCGRVLFGPLTEPPNTPDMSAGLTKDLTRREIGILTPLALACVVIGVWPKPIISVMQQAIQTNIVANRVLTGVESATGLADADESAASISEANQMSETNRMSETNQNASVFPAFSAFPAFPDHSFAKPQGATEPLGATDPLRVSSAELTTSRGAACGQPSSDAVALLDTVALLETATPLEITPLETVTENHHGF